MRRHHACAVASLRAVRLLQEWWRQKPMDPIMGVRVGIAYALVSGNGVCHKYDARSFRDCILSTLEMRDPLTRRALARCELMRLDRLTGNAPYTLLGMEEELVQSRRERSEKQQLALCFENEMCELLNELMLFIENTHQLTAMLHLQTTFCGYMSQAYHNLWNVDAVHAKIAMDAVLSRLRDEPLLRVNVPLMQLVMRIVRDIPVLTELMA